MEEQTDLNILAPETKNKIQYTKNTPIFSLLTDFTLNTDAKILEIGPNGTAHLPFLFQKAENINYFGASTESALNAVTLYNKIIENKVNFSAITNKQLDFGDSFFDCCFTVDSIYFWPEPIKYFSEIYRVLKPGGKLHLAFVEKKFGGHLPWTHLDFSFYEIDDVKSFFKQAGFTHIAVKELTETVTGEDGKETSRPFIVVSGRK